MKATLEKGSSEATPAQKNKNKPFFNKNIEDAFFQTKEAVQDNGKFFNATKTDNHFNHSETAFFHGKPVRAKLKIGQPGDKYEVEAEAMADKVVRQVDQPTKVADQVGTRSITGISSNTHPVQNQTTEKEEIREKENEDREEEASSDLQLSTADILANEGNQVQKTEEEKPPEEEDPVQLKRANSLIQKEETEEEENIQEKKAFGPDLHLKEDEELQAQEKKEKQEDTLVQKAEEGKPPEEEEPIQLKTEEEEENPDLQAKCKECEKEKVRKKDLKDTWLQSKDGGEGAASANLQTQLSASKDGGSGMPETTRSSMEGAFGADFSNVKIHTGSRAESMSSNLGAKAFTHGSDIYFNKGEYNPSSKSGQHLLAHELTHTVQQGASRNNIQKAPAKGMPQEPGTDTAIPKPTTVVDITHRLQLTQDWANYIDSKPKVHNFELPVKIGNDYEGTIKIRRLNTSKEGVQARYELVKNGFQKYLDVKSMDFLNPLRNAQVYPILVLNNFGEDQQTTGFLSIKEGEKPLLADVTGLIKGLNKNLDKMQFLGIEPLKNIDGLENKYEQGRLVFQVNSLSTSVDGFLDASGGMGIMGNKFTFNLNTHVDVAGLAQGEFTIAYGKEGGLSGKGSIESTVGNVTATVTAEYIQGVVTVQGTGKISSEKFSGEITLLVTDKARSKQMMHAALGVEAMDEKKDKEKGSEGEKKPVPKTKKNQVLVGWGEVTANITPWLSGTAKVGIDAEGHVTIVGEIIVPNEVELMEQRGKKVDIFKVEIRAGYGIPLVGQVFLFANVGMFVNAGFGPLVLKNVGFTGTYSTDPSVLQEFSITGTLGINAFAILGLEAEAGVGVTIIGHDIKAGVNVTAAAGLRAYAEATPTLQYKEKEAPQGGKVGESRLKGHFEAAAQLFLQLSGALFYELDSPWWSPAPDGREEFPLGQVQYPIGDSMGIGADMDWLIGSGEIPELTFSPIEFDADKFTSDVMADPPPRKMGKSEQKPEGKWTDKNENGDLSEDPKTKEGKGLPESKKKEENLKNLPDEQKYMRGLDEISKLEKAKPKPTLGVVEAKSKKVKAKYGLDQVKLKNVRDGSVDVYVKHAKENNGNHMVKIPLMSEAERARLLAEAMKDLLSKSNVSTGDDHSISQNEAETLLVNWKKKHPVIEGAQVVDGGKTWDYLIDIGDRSNTQKGKTKKETKTAVSDGEVKKGDGEVGEVLTFAVGGDNHRLWIQVTGKAVEIMVASTQISVKGRLDGWSKIIKQPGNEDKKTKSNGLIKSGLDKYELLRTKGVSALVEMERAEKDPTAVQSDKAIKADNEVERIQRELKSIMIQLFEIFGDDNNLIEKFQDHFHKMSSNVKIHFYNAIEKSPEKYENITKWEDLENVVRKNNSKVNLIYNHPMTKAHEFGQYIQEHPASKALESILDGSKKSKENKQLILGNKLKWIDDRAGNVKNKDTKESALVKDALVNQVKDTSSANINNTYNSIKTYFKESLKSGSVEHNIFKPVGTRAPLVNGDLTTIFYGYEGGREEFEVTFNNKSNETKKVLAKKLSFHGFGRGRVEGETKPGMDRAHIAGNEVRGTGYKSGHNLMLTSSQFNQVTMRNAEVRISDYLEEQGEGNGGVDSFDMDVEVLRFEGAETMNTGPMVERLTERKDSLEAATAGLSEDEKTESGRWKELQTLIELLKLSADAIAAKLEVGRKKKGEKRVKDVIYIIKKISFINGTHITPNEEFNTGSDVFLGIDE